MGKWLSIGLMFGLFLSCIQTHQPTEPIGNPAQDTLIIPSPRFYTKKGVAWVDSILFSGVTLKRFSDSVIHQITTYKNGKKNGLQTTWYINGQMHSKRWYLNNNKDGKHFGWWNNGNPSYVLHFKNGQFHGKQNEWYKTGEKHANFYYEEGELVGKQEAFRINGKRYINFVAKDGRYFGLNNAKLCYVVE